MKRGTVRDNVYTKIEKDSGKLRFVKPDGAWTLNLDEVDIVELREIRFMTPTKVYSISAERALEKGFNRVHGGELKLVIPVQYFEIRERYE